MRFVSLSIENFRAIESFAISDLTDFVVIAGPNGSGKSCIFDAIRLLKSAYGGYSPDELRQWLGEFGVDFNRESTITRLFRDLNKPIRITARIDLSAAERKFLKDNVDSLLETILWNEMNDQIWLRKSPPIATVQTEESPLDNLRRKRAAVLREALEQDNFYLQMEVRSEKIRPFGANPFIRTTSPAMEVAFQIFKPDSVGVIDFHGSSRGYDREEIGNIDINPQATEDRNRQHSLYNWKNKYQNIKAELASTYLRELVAQAADKEGESTSDGDLDINTTLQELFRVFFPDKSYQNVRPQKDGGLIFPVRLKGGEEHDINELSSGEKEVLYGYLRLRNSTPKNSVILLDEPELHLNPALISGLPDFYHRHLSQTHQNQIWMVTHSDALLRQAVGNASYSVYHMSAATSVEAGENQAFPVVADDELERATLDLVGDLATYRPKSKVVILEGGGDTKFDVKMVKALFPELDRRANLLSGGSKRRARDVYEILEQNASHTGTADRFYVITDSDTDYSEKLANANHMLKWDAYHIENYLLDLSILLTVTNSVLFTDGYVSQDELLIDLKQCARNIKQSLAVERLRKHLNDRLVNALKLKIDDSTISPAEGMYGAITGSLGRINSIGSELSLAQIKDLYDKYDQSLSDAIRDDSWLQVFPGRRILREFTQMRIKGKITYDGLRYLIITKMKESGHQPLGMKSVIDKIITSTG